MKEEKMLLIMKHIVCFNLAWQWRYLIDKSGFLFIGTHCILKELQTLLDILKFLDCEDYHILFYLWRLWRLVCCLWCYWRGFISALFFLCWHSWTLLVRTWLPLRWALFSHLSSNQRSWGHNFKRQISSLFITSIKPLYSIGGFELNFHHFYWKVQHSHSRHQKTTSNHF